MMGEGEDRAARLFREDAALQGLTVDAYARKYDLDVVYVYDGKIREARLRDRANREKSHEEWHTEAPQLVRRPRMTLPYAVRTVVAVRLYGGVPCWSWRTGVPIRTAERRYNKAREVILASPYLARIWRGPFESDYPALKSGRPKNATNPCISVGADVASPALRSDPLPAETARAIGNPSKPLRPRLVRSRPSRRNPRPSQRATADV